MRRQNSKDAPAGDSFYPLLRQMREQSAGTSPSIISAMSNRGIMAKESAGLSETVPANRYIIFGSIAIMGLAIDLLTKAWIFAVWPPDFGQRKVWWMIENFVGF